MQIDDLLVKLNNASGDLERLRDEKDQEIEILQAGMDSTIEQLSEAQQVSFYSSSNPDRFLTLLLFRTRVWSTKRRTLRLTP
jgi:hypothetical protein